MDRRFIIPAVTIFVFFILGFLAYNYLEIYQRKRYIAASREVVNNNFHAMELWLKETGHNIRIEDTFSAYSLTESSEKVVMVQSTAYNWRTTDGIIQWIENGGNFILCLDYSNNLLNENLTDFLNSFGITPDYSQPVITLINRNPEDEVNSSSDSESLKDDFPVFHSRVSFKIENEDFFYLLKDKEDVIRLAEIKIGEGSLIVIGMPVFMYNYSLSRESNANLAWQLTGARTNSYNKNILFVRLQNVSRNVSVFAAIFEKGNLIPVIIAVIILLIIGFWMVIPVFGLTIKEKINTSRPIKDRFTAEIQFLKKHHSLDYYLNIYSNRQKISGEEKPNKKYDYKEILIEIKKEQEKIYGN